MASKLELPADTALAKKVIDSDTKHKELKLKAGLLGLFFGDSNNVGLYIVGLISLILLVTTTVYTFIPDGYKSSSLPTDKLWNIVLPVLTTFIGYILGFNNKPNSKNIE